MQPRRDKKQRRSKLPPHMLAEARKLSGKWKIPIQTAVQIAKGNQVLSEVLEKMQLEERLAGLVQKGELLPALAPQVAAGQWSLDKALFYTRLRERKAAPDYTRCYLDDFARDQRPVALALVGREMVQGTVVESRPFDISFEDRDGQLHTFSKHDIKFYFDARRRKHLLKGIRWGDAGENLAFDALKRVGGRIDIKARALMEHQESERAIEWVTVEGDVLRGRIEWFGRYEIVLQMSKGDVYLMRHAASRLA